MAHKRKKRTDPLRPPAKSHNKSRSNSQPPLPPPETPDSIKTKQKKHSGLGRAKSHIPLFSKSLLSPSNNSFQRRSAIQTSYGKSPVGLSVEDKITFDYNVFVTTWQDQIKMRQYTNCEKYCREVIEKLLSAEDNVSIQNPVTTSMKSARSEPVAARQPSDSMQKSRSLDAEPDELHSLLEYRSKVHFSLAYLLKKYFKRYDEAREQYEQSIQTDRENPGAHFNLANMLVDRYKDYDTAKFHFEKSIQLEPTYTLYRMTYAEFLWHDMSHFEASAAQYEQLITSNNDNADIYFNYGLLLRDHLDDMDKAVLQFEQVLKVNTGDAEAVEELKYTKSLIAKQKKMKDLSEEPPPVRAKISIDCAEDADYDAQRAAYQKERKKKGSTFRKSQHDLEDLEQLGLGPNGGAGEAEDYKAKYFKAMQENAKCMSMVEQLNAREETYKAGMQQLQILLGKDGGFLKKEMKPLVKNGPNYCEVNSKTAHKVIYICSNVIAHMEQVISETAKQQSASKKGKRKYGHSVV